jgi:hypothetical protein
LDNRNKSSYCAFLLSLFLPKLDLNQRPID